MSTGPRLFPVQLVVAMTLVPGGWAERIAAQGQPSPGPEADRQELVSTPSEPVDPPQGTEGFWFRTNDGIRALWSTGRHEVYVAGYIWHAPWRYSPARRSHYNIAAWGLGYGRTTSDARGRVRSLYGVVSLDSYDRAQYMAGYGWRARWKPAWSPLTLGGGYTVMLIGRQETKYVPVPIPLPLGSVGLGKFEVLGAYVPYKDVGFLLSRMRF